MKWLVLAVIVTLCLISTTAASCNTTQQRNGTASDTASSGTNQLDADSLATAGHSAAQPPTAPPDTASVDTHVQQSDASKLQAGSTKSVAVYITKTGMKYHRAGCRFLKNSKIEISLKDAKARGYTPCSVCDPPV